MRDWISAADACQLLAISAATLYSYVSRGWVRSRRKKDNWRTREYATDDVMRLLARKNARRDPEKHARETLKWGMPILESSITRIADGMLLYRDVNVLTLATESTFESAARHLLQDKSLFNHDEPPPVPEMPPGLDAIQRMMFALLTMPGNMPFDQIVLICGGALIGAPLYGEVAGALARAWNAQDDYLVDWLNMALILCMDHELNASTFAVRVAASTKTDMPRALMAGLATLSGSRHGGAVNVVVDMLRQYQGMPMLEIRERLGRGEMIPGFGHPLYRDGDPRGWLLMRHLQDDAYDRMGVNRALVMMKTMRDLTGAEPNLDYALATLQLAGALPNDSALGIFALGRMVGWMAHAFEQQASGIMIRPRAKVDER
jgi:citrate synthase